MSESVGIRHVPAAAARNSRSAATVERSIRSNQSLRAAFQHVGSRHGIFGHLNVLLVLRSRPRSLVRHAHGRKVERVVRIQFARLLAMANRVLVLVHSAIQHGQRQVRQSVSVVCLQQFVQLADSFIQLSFVPQRFCFFVHGIDIGHDIPLFSYIANLDLWPR